MIDSRPPLSDLLSSFDALVAAGWQQRVIASQPAPDGAAASLPIPAYFNADAVDIVLVAGIHGREPAGPVALARSVSRLLERGRERGVLVMPLLNPWGYLRRERYGPSGHSVSDSDHLLDRAPAPACPEAGDITAFVMNGIHVQPGAAVLDLHEDPVYEAPDYRYEGFGSYLYFVGDAALERPASRRVREYLQTSPLPLVRDGVTRFGEPVVNGAIVDTADGSIDELFARRLGCTPVITVENLLHGPETPPLAQRVEVYVRVVEAFLDEP